ncbi:beta strand repeat-containing protein [Ferruginibacter albus]|uniref:beta strand repeat-containing protein n=1 Tax=Ferruginibacter albus TaxID=2875540 RepID=UPI001CC76C96|nr:hypothetical protein [Ferruginibacter albus]UAY52726.1 hypothetical protein K9M53_03300 [Ferruginibacter albus]
MKNFIARLSAIMASLLLLVTSTTFSQSCGILSGTIPIGPTAPASPAGFATLTAASTYINTNGIGGKTILELQSDYVSTGETFPITFSTNSCITASKTLTIRPAAGATGLIISGSGSTTNIIALNGIQYLTIDGRAGGTGSTSQLTLTSTASTGTIIRFTNDASNNKITYCELKGGSTQISGSSISNGVVFFGTANASTLAGNDNDTISYCNIHSSSSTLGYCIVSYGSTGTIAGYNDNDVIDNCNIYDFGKSKDPVAGIQLNTGSNAWKITNNSFYQTASRAASSTQLAAAISILQSAGNDSTGSGFIITGNYIGGSAPHAGSTAYTHTGIATFTGIDVTTGIGDTNYIANNIITNISFTTNSTSNTAFVGINLTSGHFNCIANKIGSDTSTGAIKFTGGSLGGLMGIRTNNAASTNNTINITQNVISGITVNGSNINNAPQFSGVFVAGGARVNVMADTIGSATIANSINAATASTPSVSQGILGIAVSIGTAISITDNLIANINNNYAGAGGAAMRGIYVTNSAATISNNTIYNLSTASQSTGSGNGTTLTGISVPSTAGFL